jgi:hypothetical protein
MSLACIGVQAIKVNLSELEIQSRLINGKPLYLADDQWPHVPDVICLDVVARASIDPYYLALDYNTLHFVMQHLVDVVCMPAGLYIINTNL